MHNKGTDKEYRENYYYVLEAKPVLHPEVVVSIMTEFMENTDGSEAGEAGLRKEGMLPADGGPAG